MRKTVYTCDYCGKDMGNSSEFTVTFKSNGLYEPKEWYYCKECWSKVKKKLTNKKDNVEELEKENEKLKKDARWYENFFTLMWNAFAESFYGKNCSERFTTKTTVISNEEKIIQAKPMGDGPFTVGCCCENTNKDSLDYKQTTAPYSSLR